MMANGDSYDYGNRNGVRPISWYDFHGLCKALAVAIAPWQPQVVLPVGRGGYYPGTLLAHLLQIEIYPVRLSRREADIVVYDSPRWLVEPPAAVHARRVIVVDEMCSTGETISLVRTKCDGLGAAETRTAVLYAHTWGTAAADYIGLVTDKLVMNPWDREILQEGAFHFHPEYVAALAAQGIEVDDSLLVRATPFIASKIKT
jgi:uncharacterized protein